MNRIIFPLRLQMRGAAVADLQDGLILLLEKARLQVSDADRLAFLARLRVERAESIFMEGTLKVVSVFQELNHNQPNGEVDERTATLLNAILQELGAFDPLPATTTQTQRVVNGRVSQADGRPFTDAGVRAFHTGDATDGRDTVRLGVDTTDG